MTINAEDYHQKTFSGMGITLDQILEHASPGDVYLVPFEVGAEREIYNKMGAHASNGSDVMVISRRHPDKLKEYGLNGNAKYIWLTTAMMPEEWTRDPHEFYATAVPLVEDFVAARPEHKGKSVVLLMDLEFLLSRGISAESALRLFRSMKTKGGIVIVPVDKIALGPENWTILRRNLEDYKNLMEKPNYTQFTGE